tara:strand:+ start:488 stop:649 length:162 start_codon:yes stop_codon:yes gene_type:complete
MNKILITFLFLSLTFSVQVSFPEGKDGFNIKKLKKIIDFHVRRKVKKNVLQDQ